MRPAPRGPQLGLITAKGPTRGMATVRALDTFDNSVAAEVTVNLRAPKVEWQHVVPITGLQSNKTYILEIVSADGTPVVFDGCVPTVSGSPSGRRSPARAGGP